MFDPNTERMIEYWRGRREDRALPNRAAIDPVGFASLAPRVFIAELWRTGEIVFRLAGDTVEELHGRSLKGAEVAPLWRPAHRQALALAIDASLVNASPLVISAHAAAAGRGGSLEILFAPLMGSAGVADQVLGYYQAARGGYPIDPPIRELSIRRIDDADVRSRPALRLATVDGQLIA